MQTAELRAPATLFARKGIGHLTELAQDHTVIITNHGKRVAVVESPTAHDARAEALRQAVDGVLGIAASIVADRSSFVSADEAKRRLRR